MSRPDFGVSSERVGNTQRMGAPRNTDLNRVRNGRETLEKTRSRQDELIARLHGLISCWYDLGSPDDHACAKALEDLLARYEETR